VGEPADGLVDGERPHFLGHSLGALAAQDRLAFAMPILWCPMTVSHPDRTGRRTARSSAGYSSVSNRLVTRQDVGAGGAWT